MKIKISKKQWEDMRKTAGWYKKPKTEEVKPRPFLNCMLDVSKVKDKNGFTLALKEVCDKYGAKLNIVKNTII